MQVITPAIELALDARNHLGETPAWCVAEQALYWVNCEQEPELLRWYPASGEVKRWPMPERIGGFAFKQDGGLLVVLARGLHDFDPASGSLTLRVASPLPEGVSLHESGVDPTGRFWVGAINEAVGPDNSAPGGGELFHLCGDRLVSVMDGISCANGLAFSPDGKALYFSDSLTRRLDRWELDPATGAISNCKVIAELADDEGVIDGSAVDSEGGYWATLVFAGMLRRYLPDGTPDITVKLPFMNPTKLAFGGADLDTAYITTMSEYDAGNGEPGRDGGVFAFKPGVTGLPEPLVT
ncbi:MAG: SMP-30/gluconolactonase/LRE family protein [Novosphingobium sp.]|nr:SMP-30/gluconolactonase/LRE family protein [Novosphingobium sp.]